MKVRIIKEVLFFEELFVVGEVYEAKKSKTGGDEVYIDLNDGYRECYISFDEYEVVEE